MLINLSPRARMRSAVSSPHCSDTALIAHSLSSGDLQRHSITKHTYTVFQTKEATKRLAITFSNVNNFKNSFTAEMRMNIPTKLH